MTSATNVTTGRSRNFFLTLNNWNASHVEALKKLYEEAPLQYLLVCAEKGDSGTPHLQGMFEAKGMLSFSTCHKAVPGMWLLKCQDKEAAVTYCKKGEQPHDEWEQLKANGPNYGKNVDIVLELGSRKSQGKRTDLSEVVEALADGKRLRDIAEENPVQFIKYSKGIAAWFQCMDKPRDLHTPLDVIVHYGPTGTGKTYYAMTKYPEAFKYSVACGAWFDGYDGQTEVVFDEYRGQLPFSHLLQLLDVYPNKVQVKGGMREFKPKVIIITTPEHPAFWYPKLEHREGKLAQLARRIKAIYYFPNQYRHGVPTKVIDHTHVPWDQYSIEAAYRGVQEHPPPSSPKAPSLVRQMASTISLDELYASESTPV